MGLGGGQAGEGKWVLRHERHSFAGANPAAWKHFIILTHGIYQKNYPDHLHTCLTSARSRVYLRGMEIPDDNQPQREDTFWSSRWGWLAFTGGMREAGP